MDNRVIKLSYGNPTIGKLWRYVKLTKNWPAFFQQNSRSPGTVVETVDRLIAILEDDAKSEIKSMTEDDLIDLHFSLGMAIRNAFDLHVPWCKLLASCGVVHPDDASGMIINNLWRAPRA